MKMAPPPSKMTLLLSLRLRERFFLDAFCIHARQGHSQAPLYFISDSPYKINRRGLVEMTSPPIATFLCLLELLLRLSRLRLRNTNRAGLNWP
jgi:hypothetical protein